MNAYVFCFELIILAPLLTCLIEIPVIRYFKISESILYAAAVNVLTNLLLNVTALLLRYFVPRAEMPWFVLAEALFIPLGEFFLYSLISKAGAKKIIIVTYAANLLSLSLGAVLIKLFDVVIESYL